MRSPWMLVWALIPLTAPAQPVVPAYEGCVIAWEYPDGVAHHQGFALSLAETPEVVTIAADRRAIACADTPLATRPLALYTLRLVATARPPARDSAPAELRVESLARPTLITPTALRITLEWALPPEDPSP